MRSYSRVRSVKVFTGEGPQSAGVFRFGPFEFRPDRGELRKSGTPLKLQPQPARLLELLVSNPGQVVKREQIQDAVWGADTQVDYELGVNRCIRQIRSVLMDSPEAPRYIRTIPRLGYSFIAPVERLPRNRAIEREEVGGTTEVTPAIVVADTVAEPGDLSPAESAMVKTRVPTEGPSQAAYRLQSILLLAAGALITLGVLQYLGRPTPAPRVDSYVQLTNDSYIKVVRNGPFERPIFADGSRVYFSVMSGAATSEIAQVSTTGGETSLVHCSLASPILFDLSPSRSRLLLGSGAGISEVPVWIQPLPTGSARRISDITAYGASWSPDQQQLAYGSGNGLYIASSSGANPRLAARFDTAGRQVVYWPRWSPDGRYIRFSVYDGHTRSSSLWEITTQGNGSRALFPSWNPGRDSCCGTWTPDNRYYVFSSSREGGSDLWITSGQQGMFGGLGNPRDPVQLTAGPLSYSAPFPHSDGNAIFTIGESRRGELMRFDPASGNFIALAPGISASQADFSRDGKQLAFVSSDGSLWRSSLDGSERRQLSFPPSQVRMPRWSPDGTHIAFHSKKSKALFSVYIFSEQDGTTRQLPAGLNHDEIDPDWSADGHRIVFSDTSLKDQASTLRIANLDTDQIAPLTGSSGLRSPRWSPDGKHIAALTADLHTLMLFDVVSQSWTRLASFRMGYPNWSHDSKYIYLVNLAHSPGICRVRVSDREVEPVVDMSRRNQFWTDDAWLGLTGGDVPVVSRDISIQHLFALHWSIK